MQCSHYSLAGPPHPDLVWNSAGHYHLSSAVSWMNARYATYHLDWVRFFIYSIPSVIGFNCGPLKLARPEIAYLLCNLYGLTGGAWGLNHVCFSLKIWPKGSAIHRTPNFFRRQNDTFWKELVPVIIFTYFEWHFWFIMLLSLFDLGVFW